MNTSRYIWQAGNTLVGVAGAQLASSGYDDVYTLMNDMYAANPLTLDWFAVPSGAVILIPYKAS